MIHPIPFGLFPKLKSEGITLHMSLIMNHDVWFVSKNLLIFDLQQIVRITECITILQFYFSIIGNDVLD